MLLNLGLQAYFLHQLVDTRLRHLPANFWKDIISPPTKAKIHTWEQANCCLIPETRYTISTKTRRKLPFPTSCMHLKIMAYSYLECFNNFGHGSKSKHDDLHIFLCKSKKVGMLNHACKRC